MFLELMKTSNGRRWFEDDLAGTLSGKYGVNTDGTNIHFVMNAEPYDPSNRVTANTTADRASTFTLKWDKATDIRAISVFAGRNGANLAGPISVTMTGDDRMQGKYILATWDGTTLTADLAP